MFGTSLRLAATLYPVLAYSKHTCLSRQPIRHVRDSHALSSTASGTSLRARYVVSGTDTAYGAARNTVLGAVVEGERGSLSSYALTMRCPVLTEAVPYACAMQYPVQV
eukprot:3934167-Rhodomonas_salina.2